MQDTPPLENIFEDKISFKIRKNFTKQRYLLVFLTKI